MVTSRRGRHYRIDRGSSFSRSFPPVIPLRIGEDQSPIVGMNQGGAVSWRGLKVGQRTTRCNHSQIKVFVKAEES